MSLIPRILANMFFVAPPAQRLPDQETCINTLKRIKNGEEFIITQPEREQLITFTRDFTWYRKLWLRVSFQLPCNSQKIAFVARLITTNAQLLTVDNRPAQANVAPNLEQTDKKISRLLTLLKDIKSKYKSHSAIRNAIKPLTDQLKATRKECSNYTVNVIQHQNQDDLEVENQRLKLTTAKQTLLDELSNKVRETKYKNEVIVSDSKDKIIVDIPTHNNIGEKLLKDKKLHDIIILCDDGDMNNPEDLRTKTLTVPGIFGVWFKKQCKKWFHVY